MEIQLGLHRTHWMASKETEVFHVVRFNFWYEAWEYTCQGDGDYEPKLEHVEGQPVLEDTLSYWRDPAEPAKPRLLSRVRPARRARMKSRAPTITFCRRPGLIKPLRRANCLSENPFTVIGTARPLPALSMHWPEIRQP